MNTTPTTQHQPMRTKNQIPVRFTGRIQEYQETNGRYKTTINSIYGTINVFGYQKPPDTKKEIEINCGISGNHGYVTLLNATFNLLTLLLLPLLTIAQCPDYEVGSMGVVEFCLDQQPTNDIMGCNGLQQYGTTIQFVVETVPTYIEVTADMWYTLCPSCDVWAHAIVSKGCGGAVVWSTFLCADNSVVVNSDTDWGGFVNQPGWPGTSWWVELDLEPGIYYLHVGGIGVPGVGANMWGCVDLTIISGLLALQVVEYKARTIGVGGVYDSAGRLIRE